MTTGVDSLLASHELLLGTRARVALLANQASLTGTGVPTLVALSRTLGERLVALLAPEHGWSGFGEDAKPVADSREARSGLPVLSLYGARRRPDRELLADLDVIVVDLQEVGVRCYTYAATLALLMEAAAEAGVRVIVCDRPNLLGPAVAGPSLAPELRSFLAYLDVPFQHGLTLGELARFHAARQLDSAIDLEVVPAQGWRRDAPPPHPFVPPSPGLPTVEAVRLYPGLVLLEGTNLSEGRGTPLPFRLLGAPWLEPYELAEQLTELNLPGLLFRPLTFVPESGKHAGLTCHGVQLHISEADSVRAFEAGVRILRLLRSRYGEFRWVSAQDMAWSGAKDAGQPWHEPSHGPLIDGLTGSDEVRAVVENRLVLEERLRHWGAQGGEFLREARQHLLYE